MEGLKNVLNEMQQSSLVGKEKEAYFVNKYSDISNKYPMIIKKACEKEFDYSKILWMIDQQNKVQTKEISQHEASVQVGKLLVDEHIKPLINQ